MGSIQCMIPLHKEFNIEESDNCLQIVTRDQQILYCSFTSRDMLEHAYRAILEHQNFWEDKALQYNRIKELGSGSYGAVYLVQHKNSKTQYAAKIISKVKIERLYARTQDKYEEAELLIEATKHRCRNVLLLYQAIEDKQHLVLVSPLYNSGNLYEYMIRNPEANLERLTRQVVRDVATGLKDLHAIGIVHRDIKPQNILIEGDSTATNCRAVIADLGIATRLSSMRATSNWKIGTDGFIAPEVYSGKPYSYSCDVFSLGCIAYWLLCGRIPFWSENSKVYKHMLFNKQLNFDSIQLLRKLSEPCK